MIRRMPRDGGFFWDSQVGDRNGFVGYLLRAVFLNEKNNARVKCAPGPAANPSGAAKSSPGKKSERPTGGRVSNSEALLSGFLR